MYAHVRILRPTFLRRSLAHISYMYVICLCRNIWGVLPPPPPPPITLDPRLPFPDSVKKFFLVPASTQKVYQGTECFFPAAGATMIEIF